MASFLPVSSPLVYWTRMRVTRPQKQNVEVAATISQNRCVKQPVQQLIEMDAKKLFSLFD